MRTLVLLLFIYGLALAHAYDEKEELLLKNQEEKKELTHVEIEQLEENTNSGDFSLSAEREDDEYEEEGDVESF